MPEPPTVTADDVRAAIDAVPDPEMPQISVGQLGMVVDVRVEGGEGHRRHATSERSAADGGAVVAIDLVPTYSSCPATRWIAEDVRAAVERLAGVGTARVRFVRGVTWSPERITAEGRAALRASSIAPPGDAPPLLSVGSQPPSWWEQPAAVCPWCGSEETRLDSPFGPTPCRAIHWCAACRNPFEAVKA
jgi:ring-1,2-phenylacetyl-CoA epoxidase subunit PaaD